MIKNLYNLYNSCLCDAPEAWLFTIQDPATPIVEGMLFFYNYIMFFIIIIGISVCFLIFQIIYKYSDINDKFKVQPAKKFIESSILEVIWTILPAFVLLFIAVPSFTLLYSLDELIEPFFTIKIIGHQWYWTYEYTDLQETINLYPKKIIFDSYMLNTDDLTLGAFRLMEVDHRLVLPIKTHIRLLVTSADVLHSWAVPSFGIKVDACPGRLSQASLFLKRSGVFLWSM